MKTFITALIFLFVATFSTAAEERIINRIDFPAYQIIILEDADSVKFMRYNGGFAHLTDYNMGVQLDLHTDIKYIEFNSPGGNILEANAIGRRIRDRGIGIVIPEGNICASACAYLSLHSKDITIDGLMAFHLPYGQGFPREMDLYQISQAGVERTLRETRTFFQNGFKAYLYLQIAKHSSIDIDAWVAFDSTEELDKFRFDDPSEFMDGVEGGGTYYVFTTEEMAEYMGIATEEISTEETVDETEEPVVD